MRIGTTPPFAANRDGHVASAGGPSHEEGAIVPTTTRTITSKRLDADEEKALARRMHAAERRARSAVRGIPCADANLRKHTRRAERTRAGRVLRLESAVAAVIAAARRDPSLRSAARRAREAWAEAERLRWELAMSGRRIAVGEARKLTGINLDEADLVQEGYIGLLRAAKRFDPERNLRFSTYARWWVRAQMTRAINQKGRQVRLPGCAVEQRRNLRKAIKMFEDAGCEWTIAQVAAEIGVDESRARTLLEHGGSISLDQPVGHDDPEANTLRQVLPDAETSPPDEDCIHDQELSRLREAIEQLLDDRLRHVILARYGLEDDRFRTLSEVGAGMKLSRERVRQLEKRALDLLRSHGEIRSAA